MKHNFKITLVLLAMFVVTQFIGIYTVNHYLSPDNALPLGLDPPEIETESDYYGIFSGIIIAFTLAILIFFILAKFKIELILKLWFFVVVIIALSISLLSIVEGVSSGFRYALILSLIIALPLAFIKIYKTNFIVHNFTELLIYPGIAAVFVPILNLYTLIGLLILISIYDIWAVWHSGIMQKMAKYQINHLKVFSGFFVPYVSKSMRAKIKNLKKTLSKSQLNKKRIKINVAILGGGDVVFPIIAAGVMLRTLGFASSLLVILGATLGLGYLFLFSEKKKFYPAMPFITAGILAGILVSYLLV